MWLTGFDVPYCHNLIQAITRVNRIYAVKEGGVVVELGPNEA